MSDAQSCLLKRNFQGSLTVSQPSTQGLWKNSVIESYNMNSAELVISICSEV